MVKNISKRIEIIHNMFSGHSGVKKIHWERIKIHWERIKAKNEEKKKENQTQKDICKICKSQTNLNFPTKKLWLHL